MTIYTITKSAEYTLTPMKKVPLATLTAMDYSGREIKKTFCLQGHNNALRLKAFLDSLELELLFETTVRDVLENSIGLQFVEWDQ